MESELAMLLVDIMPRFTTSSADQARGKLQDAFKSYYNTNGYGNDHAPDFVRAKRALAEKYRLSDNYTSRADIGELMAMLFNVVPTSFWMLLYIFSSPTLLAELRGEVQGLLCRESTDHNYTASASLMDDGHLDVTDIKHKCPLLMSTWQEVLRLISSVTTNRYVLQDTIVDDGILLKKGGLVQIPGGVMHSDPAIWGSDVNEFNPRRFMKSKQTHHPAAFRPFGGGSTLCPGRHLAHTEILGFVAAIILGFEITPKTGEWVMPAKHTRSLPGVLKPTSDVEVIIKRRAGFEKTVWSFESFSRNSR